MTGVYLIHFEQRIGNTSNPRGSAGHYLGWASDIAERLRTHRAGNGSRLMAAVSEQGIAWRCVREWAGATRADERRLHNRKNTPKLCPICHPPRETKRGRKCPAQPPLFHELAAPCVVS